MSNLVRYGSYEVDAAEEEEKQLASSGNFMKLGVGKTVLRFLPPLVGQKSPNVMVHEHYITPPGDTKATGFACPRMMFRKPCPVCQQADQLSKTGNPADREAAKELWPRRRTYANVIDRKDPDAGPKVLGFGKTIHEALTAIRKDPDAGGNYTHPTEGFDIIIERKGTSKNDTEYKVFPARNTTPLAADVETMNAWIEAQVPLDRMVRVLTSEEIEALLYGEDGAPEEPPARSRPASRSTVPGRSAAPARGRRAQDDVEEDAEVVKDEIPW